MRVSVIVADEADLGLRGLDGVEVFVIDAETRHFDPSRAYVKTLRIAKEAIDAGARHLFVKTDSGLRGNIGSMLKAALDLSSGHFLAFLPAYPDSNRITEGGIQYIDGVPIDRSFFGSDPFNPVASPYVKDLFVGIDAQIVEVPLGLEYRTSFVRPTIAVFDARTNGDLLRIAEYLRTNGQLGVVAGCAGFAQVLPEVLSIPKRKVDPPRLDASLLVVCGSLHPVARAQIECAERSGFVHVVLEPYQQLECGYLDSDQGSRWVDSLEALFSGEDDIVIDTGISRQWKMQEYLEGEGMDKECARERIAAFLGSLTKRLFECGYAKRRALVFIGGDTFLSSYQALGCSEIELVCELDLGTVLSSCRVGGEALRIISKSGGLGDESLLVRLAKRREALSGARP